MFYANNYDNSACTCATAVWTYWNSGTSITATSANANASTWIGWNASSTITTVTYSDPWASWSNAASDVRRHAAVIDTHRRTETPQQQAARLEREREYQARRDAERAERLAAERKAEVLLLRHLSDAQREEYQRTGAFTVRMSDGRSYRIKKGRSGNVEHFEAPKAAQVLERGGGLIAPAANGPPRQIERLCIHPVMMVPDCDNMLAQKLLLESNEAEFRRIANITRTG